MAWKRETGPTPIPVVSPGRPIVASAALYPVNNQMWKTFRFTDTAWQQELWRLYDSVPEFHFLVNYVGGACGRTRIYAADVDANGRVQQETEDTQVAEVVDNMLGGPEAKAECIRSIAINLEVAGEVWIVGRQNPDTEADEWLIVSAVELRRWQGGYWLGYGDDKIELVEGRDLLIRAWTPHPRFMMFPDSPSRSVYPILIEIEKLTRYIFSQLDSRLASAGVWILPSNLDFPAADDQTPSGQASLLKTLIDTASASLKGEGSAAALVPTLLEAPPDLFDKIKDPIKFESVLSDQTKVLRDEAIGRLALGMDTPPEALSGMGESTHWNSWHIDESTIKSVIEPLMNRICDALNKAYFLPALKAMGKDPKKFTLACDTSGLTVRPQRLQDTLNLNAAGITSNEAVLLAGDYRLTDAPSDEERDMKWARSIAALDPLLLQNPEFCKMAQLPDYFISSVEKANAQTQIMNAGPPPPPAPETTVVPHSTLPPIPANSTAPGAPNTPKSLDKQRQQTNTPKSLASSAYSETRAAVIVAADFAARRAFELAGARQLTRELRGRVDVPKHEIHCHVPVRDVTHAKTLIAGAFEHFEKALSDYDVDAAKVQSTIASYCVVKLMNQSPHDKAVLVEALNEEGVFG